MSRALSICAVATLCASPVFGQAHFSLALPQAAEPQSPFEFMCGVQEAPAMPSLCFAPGTSPEVMEAVNTAIMDYMNQYFPWGAQWGTQGQPYSLTWSFVPDQLMIPGDVNVGDGSSISTLFASMDTKFGGFNSRPMWIAQFQACFDRWEQLTGINFSRIQYAAQEWDDGAAWDSFSNANRGDVRIAMHPIDGVNNILAFCYFPNANSGKAGNMVLDVAENWNNGASHTFLRNTVTHEMGHGLGLMHVCPATGTKLMEPFLSLNYDGPQHDDLRGMQYLYGDKFEPNNNTGTATVLAATTVGGTLDPSQITQGPAVTNGTKTSLEVGDEDWFKSSVAAPVVATIEVTPRGSSYDSSTQNQNGTCNSGTTVDSTAQADLAFEVRAADGTTVWVSQNSVGSGAPEYRDQILLSPPGIYYVRVYANGAVQGTQAYELTIHGDYAPGLSASDGTFPGNVRVAWSSLPSATQYAIYRGITNSRAQASLLTTIAPNDHYDDMSVAVGQTYYYWVEVNTGTGGMRALAGPDAGSASLVPVNDACSGATAIGIGDYSGSTVNATNDGSATCGSSNTSKDVWFNFTAPASGTVRFTTCGTHDTGGVDAGMDTVLSLYSGCPGTSGNQIACNDDAGGLCAGMDTGAIRDSSVIADVTVGQHVLVRVAGYNGSNGVFSLHSSYLPPGNDECAAAMSVSNGVTNFGTMGATTDGPDEPTSPCNVWGYSQIGSDVWFKYTATCTGQATISLCGSNFDTKMAVYSEGGGCPANSGGYLVCNDDFCGWQSSVTFAAVAGWDYRIRVGGFHAATGQATMTIGCVASCGSSDFNCDGDSGTDADIEAFFACVAGNCPAAPCDSTADFNFDGDTGTDADIEAFFRVLAGGAC